MKRHEYEQECLQMILDKKPEDFLEEFEYGDMKEFLADFLVSYAEYRNQPAPVRTTLTTTPYSIIRGKANHTPHTFR